MVVPRVVPRGVVEVCPWGMVLGAGRSLQHLMGSGRRDYRCHSDMLQERYPFNIRVTIRAAILNDPIVA